MHACMTGNPRRQVKKLGLAKAVGVSNFGKAQLEGLKATGTLDLGLIPKSGKCRFRTVGGLVGGLVGGKWGTTPSRVSCSSFSVLWFVFKFKFIQLHVQFYEVHVLQRASAPRRTRAMRHLESFSIFFPSGGCRVPAVRCCVSPMHSVSVPDSRPSWLISLSFPLSSLSLSPPNTLTHTRATHTHITTYALSLFLHPSMPRPFYYFICVPRS